MERNFRNSDFERFVQKNADQYRMFPSEKVWNNVHKALHKRRRWYGLGLAFLLVLTGTAVMMVMRSYPIVKKQNNIAEIPQSHTASTPEMDEAKTTTDIRDLIVFDDWDREAEEAIRVALAPEPNVLKNNDEQETASFDFDEETETRTTNITHINNTGINSSDIAKPVMPTITGLLVSMEDYLRPVTSFTAPAEEPVAKEVSPATVVDFDNPPPYTIESVISTYKPGPKRVNWQVFLTPTVSYRVLSANKDFQTSPGGGPLPLPFAGLANVNSAVTHKPDLGFQLGVTGRYPVTNRLNLRGGFQVNVNKYDIKAFAYPGEVAVINLDDPNSTTVATWTRYRSQNGYKSDWLKNSYISVSLPIGAELQLFGNKKTNVGIAGTIQPTYVVRDKAYLISTDFKNYAQVPWLIRRVNISTGFEAFVNYGKGNTRWQVGPQVRYQMLSSFQNKYPVKENLFDFGVKIGVSVNNP